GRLVALRGIVRSKDVLRDLYIVAATRDSGAAIQKWVGDTLAQRPLSTARFNELLAIVDGKDDGSYLLAGIKAPATSLQPASVAGIATDVDLESELEEFEASEGEVVFYDIEDSLEDDQPKAAESDISEDKPASADAPASYEE